MKKTLLITLTLFSLASFTSSAQDAKSAFKINPLSALLRTGSVFYEHKLSKKESFQLGAAYLGLKIEDVKFSGFSVTPEYRYYPKENALSGLYIGPYLRYQNLTVKDETSKGSYSSVGGGVVLGRQWVYKSGFVLDLFFGPSYNSGKVKADDGSEEPDVSVSAIDGFGIRTGILIGFSL